MRNLGIAAACAVSVGGTAMAGGIERSPQSVNVLFEQGRYVELGFSFASPEVSGVGGPASATPGAESGNILEDFTNLSFAFKDDIGDRLSYAFILDQPYGANVAYPASTYFGTNTTAELNVTALTGILQYNLENNVSVYGGARIQSIDAKASIPFISGYTIDGDRDISVGYLVGVAYEKPELALRVALTYNSAIGHDLDTTESFSPTGTVTSIDTPQSVNLEFQSGINPKTLVFGSVRWVEWSDFEIAPPAFFGATGSPLAFYADDRITYNLGVGRALNENWSIFGTVGHERTTGSPTGNLTPTDGFTRYTVGATYSKDNMKITGGVSYVDIGRANSVLPTAFPAGIFSGNSAVGVGIRVGFSF